MKRAKLEKSTTRSVFIEKVPSYKITIVEKKMQKIGTKEHNGKQAFYSTTIL